MNKAVPEIIEGKEIPAQQGRRSDGGVYLVVADESDEFPLALHYAARQAKAHRGHLAILHVIDIQDFQHWNKVEDMMRKELRDKAEKFVWAAAKKVNELNETMPILYIREGEVKDVIVDVINEDISIKTLVLAGGVNNSSSPGSLVGHFSSKGLARLRVPLLIVPGHLDNKKIDDIAR